MGLGLGLGLGLPGGLVAGLSGLASPLLLLGPLLRLLQGLLTGQALGLLRLRPSRRGRSSGSGSLCLAGCLGLGGGRQRCSLGRRRLARGLGSQGSLASLLGELGLALQGLRQALGR